MHLSLHVLLKCHYSFVQVDHTVLGVTCHTSGQSCTLIRHRLAFLIQSFQTAFMSQMSGACIFPIRDEPGWHMQGQDGREAAPLGALWAL